MIARARPACYLARMYYSEESGIHPTGHMMEAFGINGILKTHDDDSVGWGFHTIATLTGTRWVWRCSRTTPQAMSNAVLERPTTPWT